MPKYYLSISLAYSSYTASFSAVGSPSGREQEGSVGSLPPLPRKGVRLSFSYQYLRDIRIRRSIFLMEQGLVSVKNIASLSGFSDALYFSKVFASVEGIPPSEYIARLEGIKNQ